MTSLPATIDLNPSGTPIGSVIWLHGLGADANDFVPIVDQLKIFEEFKVRFVFPSAPVRPITINGGMKMRAWYDIYEINLSAKEDVEGIRTSEKLIDQLIEREIDMGISSERIVLAGFSQGGAMILHSGLRYAQKLGGIVALSTYLPVAKLLHQEKHLANLETPIFMAHGLFDPVVPLMMGEISRQLLQGLGYAIDWHTYSMPHSVLPEEIQDISRFLHKIFSKAVA